MLNEVETKLHGIVVDAYRGEVSMLGQNSCPVLTVS